MIEFRKPQLTDRAWLLSLLAEESLPLCNYSFPVLFCWQDAYRFKIARVGDRVLIRLRSSLGHAYLWPVGKGDPTPAIDAIRADAKANGEPLRLIGLTLYHRNWLADRCPGAYAFAETRDGFDYLYRVDRLADLPGKKLHAKRNHIRRFDDACPGWTWTALTNDDIPDCQAMDDDWHRAALERETGEELTSLEEDRRAMSLALTHREALGLEGVVLRWEGRVLAFALGAPLTGTIFDVHFERARGEIQGAYAAVNRVFAQYVRERHPEIEYLDREDDMGVPGLRKAKLSYYPDHLEENYCAVEAAEPETLAKLCGCESDPSKYGVAGFIP